jgi:hypothetical protein
MDKALLVNIDLERGQEVLRALDVGELEIKVALWLYASEYEDWRLVISSRRLENPKTNYGLVVDAFVAAGLGADKTPPFLILPMSDKFVRDLRRMFGKTKDVEGMRLGGQMIGDRWVEDAYVYRIK